jgi:alkanesulfonate monooxygenase SsuD/methylene tetrahydromethanopterin reductase-like flavin-dependent oxidoreductase (luciferase family)
MRYGVVLPGGTAPQQLALAIAAEKAGWDGVFVWEAAYGVDAWTLLGAKATNTSRIRLGTMLTPLPWRRPWKVASQAATLDQLSGGRTILAVGTGAVATGLGQTGEVLDVKHRAAMLDEGIDLLRAFWRGNLAFSGEHYEADVRSRPDLAAAGSPVQDEIPVWVVGAWPRERSLRRALRCSGVIPELMDGVLTPEVVREIRKWYSARGAARSFDIVVEGESAPHADAAAITIHPWAEAGATWWMETQWTQPRNAPELLARFRARIEAGPPQHTELHRK